MPLSPSSGNALRASLASVPAYRELKNVLDKCDDFVHGATLTVAAESADMIETTIQLTDADGNAITSVGVVEVLLLNAGGTAVNANAYTVAAGASGIVSTMVANVLFKVITNSSGQARFRLTIATAVSCQLNLVLPSGKVVTAAIAHA
jgi:hypothetical protein